MGFQDAPEALFYDFRLEDHIPADHVLRRIDELFDLSFVRDSLKAHYSRLGRPSVDPELMIRMLLVGYLFGIRSERRLCAEVHLNLAYRWFCRLGLEGKVPDQSTFSKNRYRRFRQSPVFRDLFETVVRQCLQAGLVRGEDFSVDGSLVEADANRDRRIAGGDTHELATSGASDEVSRPVAEYFRTLDEEAEERVALAKAKPPKYLSQTDPMSAWNVKDGRGKFGYLTNYMIDNANGIIVDVEATPARTAQEIIAAKTMIERTKHQLTCTPQRLAADKAYGSGAFLTWLCERKIEPHIPVLDRKQQTSGKLTRDTFSYDPERDVYICPQGAILKKVMSRAATRLDSYRSKDTDCRDCLIKKACTKGKHRQMVRMWDEPAREKARELAVTEAFEQCRRDRKKVEMRFAHLKRHLGLRRLKLRGLSGAQEEFTLAAAAQNLKMLARHRYREARLT